jgi:hypothetical protein
MTGGRTKNPTTLNRAKAEATAISHRRLRGDIFTANDRWPGISGQDNAAAGAAPFSLGERFV